MTENDEKKQRRQADPESGIRGYERIDVLELKREPPEVPDNTPAQWLARPWRAA